MEINAYCKCEEGLTWHQLVNSVWVDVSDQFVVGSAYEMWIFTPTQLQLDAGEPISVRYCCDDVCSNTMEIVLPQIVDPTDPDCLPIIVLPPTYIPVDIVDPDCLPIIVLPPTYIPVIDALCDPLVVLPATFQV